MTEARNGLPKNLGAWDLDILIRDQGSESCIRTVVGCMLCCQFDGYEACTYPLL